MPIKLPKGFARRKSSGNALEESENPPQPSFRVFERPSVERKSFSDGNLASQKLGEGPQSHSPPDDDNIFAASGGPPVRNLIGGAYETPPPNGRFSSSARRSTDGPTQFDSQSPHSRNLHDIPLPPFSGALRAAGRTFSFGGRFSKAATAPAPPQPSSPDPARHRALTSSTTSTATPPQILDSEIKIGRIDDDFGNMFDDIGKRGAQQSSEPCRFASVPNTLGSPFRKEEKASRPAPISTDRSREIEPSPYSWSSRHSEEGLLNAVDSPQEDSPAFQPTPANSIPVPLGNRRKSLPLSNPVPATTTSHRSLEKPKMAVDKGLRRSVMFSTKRDTVAVEDEDAKLVMESLYSSKRTSQLPFSSSPQDSDDVPLFGNGTTVKGVPQPQESLAQSTPEPADDHIDASIADHARLAAQYESKPIPPSSSNKVMTPSQFEHYRQQQELKRANSDASESEDSAESDFDEEDEAEKNREAERQRRKQEAHLSVYRQQMMKVTGQQSPSPSLRPEIDRASSTPNLVAPSLQPGHRSGSGKSSEGDDDDEIPLGILAAHGFPNRNRPPSRLVSSNSMQNLRASFHQPYVGAPGSAEDVGNRNSLPVFARNLPRDPYFGASLVNPSNRESLALGGGGAGSVYGGPTATGSPSPALPPGGLVGVIATEERARAMRRGSPNTQAMHEFSPGMLGGAGGHAGSIPRPYTMLNLNSANGLGAPPPVSATEQAQIQLSHQMTSMMQMQMQWMQQMIQIQGGQVPPQQFMPPPGNMPPGFVANTNSRPSSMPSAPGPFTNGPPSFAGNQRTLSMLDPNMSSRLNSPSMPFIPGGNRPGTPGGAGYAPSIAPSERSNVGLAPRYRPVSTVPVEAETASYPALSKPWNDENRRTSMLSPSTSSNLAKPVVRPVSSHNRSHSKLDHHVEAEDEDDDEGWAEMMKKREKKRNNWKIKKESSSFGDLLNAVH
ncbi:hypothetical protein P175DRAFT_0441323 [Aspergillus ochraceoroseus IBT 24754]|uniref:Uncharacterized protein n=3 Tax=Aspergillus subgen. Nidulantes TaxID=2720870 RepID=A0A0F8VLY8_9EURO|nr:uncharacterized protein P175DRAFT_0441323 [Aspergillus ochraceoroseus IBT 24754]KKK15513.1 hypothetical protein AOCH_004377 [Aspergillus ochraceoroseus]KKK24116.1 hypothetical protein ARAM_003329 [Aspergillus rambellii]PTU19179.1 hypothetical protein P175DRAFT_0441323 [Aspergillus ochraceoroseus IBT 24754]